MMLPRASPVETKILVNPPAASFSSSLSSCSGTFMKLIRDDVPDWLRRKGTAVAVTQVNDYGAIVLFIAA